MDRSISESYLISLSIIFASAVLSLGLSLFRSGTGLVSVFTDKYAIATTDNRDVVADFQKGDVSLNAILVSAYKTEGVYKITLKDKDAVLQAKSFFTYQDVMHPIAMTSNYIGIEVVNVEKTFYQGYGFEVTITLDYSNLSSEEKSKLAAFYSN